MANTSSEVQTSSRRNARDLGVRVPLGVRWLAYLSTTHWQPHPPVHREVAEMAAAMQAEGWMIRGAWARNYLLWRDGRTMRETRLPFLVLPLAYGRLSALHINVFLTVELLEARSRFRRDLDHGPFSDETAGLQSTLNLIAAETGIVIHDPFRIHHEAAHVLARVTH